MPEIQGTVSMVRLFGENAIGLQASRKIFLNQTFRELSTLLVSILDTSLADTL